MRFVVAGLLLLLALLTSGWARASWGASGTTTWQAISEVPQLAAGTADLRLRPAPEPLVTAHSDDHDATDTEHDVDHGAECPRLDVSPASQDPAMVLQNLTEHHFNRLAGNPSLATQYLSRAEQLAGPRLHPANFGKALERAVGADVKQSYGHILQYVGGPNNPDFKGVGAHLGREFDITTFLGQGSHFARSYGTNLELILYTRPSPWR